MNKSGTFFELIEAMGEPGCPVCRLVDKSVRARIDAFFYEQLNIIERRAEIRDARGFCSAHASLLPGPARMAGTAILHHDILNDVARQITALAPRRTGSFASVLALALRGAIRNVRDAVVPRRNCVLCDYERDQEVIYLRALARDIKEKRLYEAFKSSTGLCLPHFQTALGVGDVAVDHLAMLIDLELAHIEQARDELAAYMRKSNGSYDDQGPDGGAGFSPEEADSPLRAARMVSGRILRVDGRR
jgi:hypothetical protein